MHGGSTFVSHSVYFLSSSPSYQIALLTFPGFPPKIRMTDALRRSTSGRATSCVAITARSSADRTPQRTHLSLGERGSRICIAFGHQVQVR